jgi:Skp family chaperone for outer membrane proteins
MFCRTVSSAVVVCILACFGVSTIPHRSLAEDTTKPENQVPAIRVAIVDFSKVFRDYKKKEELEKKMKEKFDARNEALSKRKQELIDREKQLRNDTRDKNDPAYAADIQRWGYDKSLFDKDFKEFGEELTVYNFKQTKQIVAEISEAIRRCAESKGFDIVLKLQNTNEEAKTFDEYMRQVTLNPVVYFSAKIDITDMVLLLLNTAYAKGIQLVPEQKTEPAPK